MFHERRAHDAMERRIIGKCRIHFWCVVFASFLLWFLLLYFYDTTIMVGKNTVTWIGDNYANLTNSEDSSSMLVGKNPNENVKKAEDFAEPIYATTKYGNKPIDVFGVAVDDSNFVSDKESESNNQEHVTENDEESGNEEGVVDSLPIVEKKTARVIRQPRRENVEEVNCTGKYIFVHRLPRRFNENLIKNCRSLSDWHDLCPYTSDFGLGPRFEKPDKAFSRTGWYTTNQFMLEVIFHSRMKQYKCLTTNSSLASAIFVPYYAGLDVARYLWGSSISIRDSATLDLVKWLRQKPEWKRMWGRDHFLVAGRITWDFRRLTDEESAWGNKLMLLPESRNMTILEIESSPWNNNDFAIPYPTYFHPSSDQEVFQWQNRMRRQKRRVLFSFVGATRPNILDSIRAEIIDQCIAAGRKCKLLDCNSRGRKCYKPVFVMKTFQSSVFCLQPPGDSYTRRSTFDSILAGCIPVFFHPGSAYVQYLWHLPKDYKKYSVFIPANDIKDGKVSIERILHKIPKRKMMAMREEVIKLIPNVIYADPKSRLETLEDAFDVTVKGVLERFETIRREIKEGKNSSSDYPEVFSWKYNLFGTVKEHEWDPMFERT